MSFEKAAIRFNAAEEIDINKTSESKECMASRYWYFKDVCYKFQPHVCNVCHAVSMMVYELKNISILNAKNVDYSCVLWGIRKNDAVSRLNYVLQDKGDF